LGLLSSSALGGCGGDGGPKPAVIPLVNPDGAFWGPMLKVGGQSFLVDLDTGSTTTAIAGAGCTSCSSVGVAPLYTPGATAKDDKQTARALYGDMSGWSGEIYTDTVSLGDGTPTLSYPLVDISDNVNKFFFDSTGYQGILGLGAPENAVRDTGSYFSLAEQSGEVPIMAFELCSTTGSMWLGGFDSTKAASAPVYTPLIPITTTQPFYSIDIQSMALGSTTVAQAADFHPAAGAPIVDTGTTFFTAPESVVTSALATVNASPGFKSLFGNTAQFGMLSSANQGCITQAGVTEAMVDAMLPPLTFTFPNMVAGSAGVTVSVKPSASYILDLGTGEWCFGMDTSQDGSTVLGDSLLRAFVTIIDLQNQQVGWAPDLGCTLSTQRRAIDRATFHPHPARPRPQFH
jgi:hypothetical protein